MTPTVEQGRDLYRAHKHPHEDPRGYLAARPGTVAYGRLLARANAGDPEAKAKVREWADRGNTAAQDVLDGALDPGEQFTAGTEPGSFTADDVR